MNERVTTESNSASALRMRRLRKRKRTGLRCLMVELRQTEVDELIRQGFLSRDVSDDYKSVVVAFYAFLDQHLNLCRVA